jgi:hypothetical protein
MRDCGVTPLCHSVTSPPQGGRLFLSDTSFRASRHAVETLTAPFVISPLEGEMPDRAEGGKASPRARFSVLSAPEAAHAPHF